jgi:FtsP/CotA-like multicopper oxidase with cupredoxin domain
MRFSVIALFAVSTLTACGSDPVQPDPQDPFARAYAPTGQTKTFDLRAQDLEWEVGVGAVYKAWTYNGTIPGPTLEANAGDKIVINLRNDTAHPVSIHTHIVEFAQAQDGVDATSVAMPGQTVTVEWQATFAGAFPYHDHAMEAEGVARGMFGALIVHAPDEAEANEHVVVMGDFDAKYYKQLPGIADPVTGMISMVGEFRGAHQYMHTINGKAYEDAIPKFTGKVGELSRWRVISIGAEQHTWHIHGHRWVDGDGRLTDNIQLAPGMYRTFEFVEDKPGDWLVHCHFPNHMEGGMMARYLVEP